MLIKNVNAHVLYFSQTIIFAVCKFSAISTAGLVMLHTFRCWNTLHVCPLKAATVFQQKLHLAVF